MTARRIAVAVAALLLALAPSAVAAAVAPVPPPTASPPVPAAAAPPAVPGAQARTPVDHFVVLMQSGHSFDNYFGTYPGADGIPPGACQSAGTRPGCVSPYPIGDERYADLAASAGMARAQYDDGRMDAFASAQAGKGVDPRAAMGYYRSDDLPYYWNVASRFTLFDRYFSSALSNARANRFYAMSGVFPPGGADRVPPGGYEATTIFDRLEAAGVPWKVYVENYDPRMTRRGPDTGPLSGQTTRLPLLDIDRVVDDPRMFSHVVDLGEYDRDLRAGTLPAVSYVVPAGSAENPPSRVGAGQDLVRRLTSELARSSAWPRSAFFWTYDSWGGWYDHVPPPRVDEHGDGFRVPALMMSPYSAPGVVDHTTLDHTAVLRFIEDNWGLAPLGPRDAASPGLASAFDFRGEARPAELPSPTHVAPQSRAAPQGLIYGAYAVAVLLAGVLAVVAARTQPRRREST